MFDTINFDKIPFIDIKKQNYTKNCAIDYIDSLKWDIVKYPVMWGIDHYKRKFIVIKCSQNRINMMQTFFQRYADTTSYWSLGECKTDFLLLSKYNYCSINGVHPIFNYFPINLTVSTCYLLEEFINKKSILPSEWVNKDINYFNNSIDINKKIELINDIKTKWEIIIEKIRLYNILSNNLTKFPIEIILKIINFVLI